MTLTELIAESTPAHFPCDALKGAKSAICFFSAAFMGIQDAIHMAAAGIPDVTCVDTNGGKLADMANGPYADLCWTWLKGDAFSAAGHLEPVDVVTCDPFSGNCMRRVLEGLDAFAALAKKWLVVGNTIDCVVPTPKDFELVRMHVRSTFKGGTFWAVFKRIGYSAYATRSDVDYLDLIGRLTENAEIVLLREQKKPTDDSKTVALRHDLCGFRKTNDVLGLALEFARLEAARGIRSTFFPISSAPYWHTERFGEAIREIAGLGHEIGLHCDAVTQWVKKGETPEHWVRMDLEHLRQFAPVLGAASHGDVLCYKEGARYNNYECWTEYDAKKNVGGTDLNVPKISLADVGLDYEAYLNRGHTHYLSDSGGKWRGGPTKSPVPFERGWSEDLDWVVYQFRGAPRGSLQVLVHPTWWEIR